MSDLPKSIRINEEGPREGFQFEKGPIATARKVELINALSNTGLKQIQIVSFVPPQNVPGMADADEVVHNFTPNPNVAYTALWLNERGLQRALGHDEKLHLFGSIGLTCSAPFLLRNQKRTMEENLETQRSMIKMYQSHGIAVRRGSLMAAFGCNFAGDIAPSLVADMVGQQLDIAAEAGEVLEYVSLADTMAWATPLSSSAWWVLCAPSIQTSNCHCIFTIPAAWASPTPMLVSPWVSIPTMLPSPDWAAARLPRTRALPATSALKILYLCVTKWVSKPVLTLMRCSLLLAWLKTLSGIPCRVR